MICHKRKWVVERIMIWDETRIFGMWAETLRQTKNKPRTSPKNTLLQLPNNQFISKLSQPSYCSTPVPTAGY